MLLSVSTSTVAGWMLGVWFCIGAGFVFTDAFSLGIARSNPARRAYSSLSAFAARDDIVIVVGDLLGDLPTPAMLLELSLAENALNGTDSSLDDLLSSSSPENQLDVLQGCVFVHTKVTDTSVRDRINAERGSGKSPVIGSVDAVFVKGGAYLGLGLSNHHVGGYYWARSMGIGASLEAHGVGYRSGSGGELYWEKRDSNSSVRRGSTTYDSSNSNDGKRSEWADFLVEGDTVQLIPFDASLALTDNNASFSNLLVGVRRAGRPLGADPIVEKLWERNGSTGSWTPLQ